LKILAGKEVQDNGKVMVQNGIDIGYLEQEPELDPSLTIREYISQGNSGMMKLYRNMREQHQHRQKILMNAPRKPL
jgi:ABC transport system ATP-binding/permease protein